MAKGFKRPFRRTQSIESFGTPDKPINDQSPALPKKGLKLSTHVRSKRRRSCCRKASYIILAIVLVSFVIGAGLFAAAELTSRPGYDKVTQDTASGETMLRIQSARQAMPQLATRFASNQPQLTKQELIDHVRRATAFSSASYTATYAPQECPFPVGANLSRTISTTRSRVLIARDDVASQLVVSFKGLSGPLDYIRALQTEMLPLNISGLVVPADVKVQRGVLESYRSIEQAMLDTTSSELASRNSNSTAYSILVTGHNTGGSMAVLAALSLKSTFPNSLVLVVTQGQPRSFNQAGADFIDTTFPPNSRRLIRLTHTQDGIPTVPSPITSREARHHSGEVWQVQDPATPSNFIICNGQEDPSCSISNIAAAAGGSGSGSGSSDGGVSRFLQFLPPALFYNAESLHYSDIELNSKKSVQCGGPGGQFQYALFTARSNGVLRTPPSVEALARVP